MWVAVLAVSRLNRPLTRPVLALAISAFAISALSDHVECTSSQHDRGAAPPGSRQSNTTGPGSGTSGSVSRPKSAAGRASEGGPVDPAVWNNLGAPADGRQ